MRDLPSGTVTFLFTDIEGSTKLLHELGPEGYAAVQSDHHLHLREAFTRHGGVEVDTQGDAFFYAFPTALGAVEAANAGQEALASGPVEVRMGIHTGAPHATEEGYVGSDVNKGARIAAAGHGGQVLLSKETIASLKLRVTDLGEHRLKDFEQPIWIFQLGDKHFPPLKTISNSNLPHPASSFVGRAEEVSEIAELVQSSRLLTLSGPGGTGKTRLAIEAASGVIPQFRNGVFWVGLATLTDPALVLETAAQSIGAKDGLAEHISDRQILLVLDNLEQVIDAAPDLSALLMACPNLHLLVTSRELLRIDGEAEYAVPPLDEAAAVQLFSARSGLVANDAIAQLCRSLDHLPLAVELAAARTSVLSPEKILERLSQRLDLLKGGRDADPRQATLRATIEWSYELLSADEKELFALLAVFRGGCTLEAAEEVIEADLDPLQSLIDKSLLRHTDDRFWMLETIRGLALEKFSRLSIGPDMRRRHADHFLGFAEEAEPHLRRSIKEWLNRVEVEHDNLRAVFDYFDEFGDTQSLLRLAGSLMDFWAVRGHYAEATRRLSDALRADPRPTPARAKALNAASDCAMAADDVAGAKLLAEEALEIHRGNGDSWGEACSLFLLGDVAASLKDWQKGRALFELCVRMFRELGDEDLALWSSRMLAWTYAESGDTDRARSLQEDNLRRARLAGNQHMEAGCLDGLATIEIEEGRGREAMLLLHESYVIWREIGDGFRIGLVLVRFARSLAAQGMDEDAARCLASGEMLLEETGASPPWVKNMLEKASRQIASQLSEDRLATAMEEGRTMSGEAVIALAVDRLGARSSTT
ncbi:MAG: tetratricopeptide repeat protein [Actinobacteria bacterium]|nr:tetratricopeptide repeat protein [Actinomycetota bacterium]